MSINKKQQKGLVFEDRNGVELPMKYEDGHSNGASAAGVAIINIDNHPYPENNPNREIINDDDDDNTADDTDI